MKNKRIVIGGGLVLVALPIVLLLIGTLTIHFLDRTNGSLMSSGQSRTYLVHVPPSYDSSKPTSLVISMHGASGWPAQQKSLSRWNRLADRLGFIVVYPSGTGTPKIWHVFRAPGLERDVRFISEMIDTLERSYNIDPTRIYADGISNGGGMAFVLSCTMSDRIAAIGLVASAQTLPWSWCTDHRPVPMIAFHGTADPIIPYRGGRSPLAPEIFPDIPMWVADWAQRNRCAPTPSDSTLAADVTRRTYGNCADDAAVVLYTIRGGGHSWPGGKPLPEWLVGTTSREINATSAMWAFFRQHRLHEVRSGAQ